MLQALSDIRLRHSLGSYLHGGYCMIKDVGNGRYSRTGDSKLTVEMEEIGTVLLYLFLLHLLYALGVL